MFYYFRGGKFSPRCFSLSFSSVEASYLYPSIEKPHFTENPKRLFIFQYSPKRHYKTQATLHYKMLIKLLALMIHNQFSFHPCIYFSGGESSFLHQLFMFCNAFKGMLYNMILEQWLGFKIVLQVILFLFFNFLSFQEYRSIIIFYTVLKKGKIPLL